jgi:hypothetical protein
MAIFNRKQKDGVEKFFKWYYDFTLFDGWIEANLFDTTFKFFEGFDHSLVKIDKILIRHETTMTCPHKGYHPLSKN